MYDPVAIGAMIHRNRAAIVTAMPSLRRSPTSSNVSTGATPRVADHGAGGAAGAVAPSGHRLAIAPSRSAVMSTLRARSPPHRRGFIFVATERSPVNDHRNPKATIKTIAATGPIRMRAPMWKVFNVPFEMRMAITQTRSKGMTRRTASSAT